jgi:hypothetical protein
VVGLPWLVLRSNLCPKKTHSIAHVFFTWQNSHGTFPQCNSCLNGPNQNTYNFSLLFTVQWQKRCSTIRQRFVKLKKSYHRLVLDQVKFPYPWQPLALSKNVWSISSSGHLYHCEHTSLSERGPSVSGNTSAHQSKPNSVYKHSCTHERVWTVLRNSTEITSPIMKYSVKWLEMIF